MVLLKVANYNNTSENNRAKSSLGNVQHHENLIFQDILFRIIYGTDESDHIEGSEANEIIYGKAGIDFLFGVGGNDSIYGGADNDILGGGDGDDRLFWRRGQ